VEIVLRPVNDAPSLTVRGSHSVTEQIELDLKNSGLQLLDRIFQPANCLPMVVLSTFACACTARSIASSAVGRAGQ
jgi:hypothetical protein